MTAEKVPDSSSRLGWGAWAVGALLLANVVVPLMWGDFYPFTSAPMFRDAPVECANYRVFAPDGTELPQENWLCQRIYDGNPVGYGVGIQPPPVLEQEYGKIASEDEIRAHFRRQFEQPQNRKHSYVEVVQEVIGGLKNGRVGVIQTRRMRIDRPA